MSEEPGGAVWPSRRKARSALCAALTLGLLAPGMQALAAEARCRCQIDGTRASAAVEVGGLVDAEMERLIRLGLVGHLRWELTLSRKRWLWVEQQVGQVTLESSIRFSDERRVFVVEGMGDVADLSRITMETAGLPLDAPAVHDGRYELRVRAELRVVTAESLRNLAVRMLGGSDDKEESSPSSWVERRLFSAVSTDLQRVTKTTCPATPAQPPDP
jgi:hypothetical protein